MQRAPLHGAAAGAAAPREVSESCFEYLQIELLRHYGSPDAPLPAKATLESIGLQVGHQLVERLTRERPRFADNLEVVKFVCKELWGEVFRKQVDNLKTNYRGVYVLTDNRFRWLLRAAPSPASATAGRGSAAPSAAAAGADAGGGADAAIQTRLHFPCGLLRGALAALGVNAAVTADCIAPPAVQFTIRIK